MVAYSRRCYVAIYLVRPKIKWVSRSIHTISVLQTRKLIEKCAVIWYMDNLKVFHMDSELVRNILKLIESKF